jgi:hypothetical protein
MTESTSPALAAYQEISPLRDKHASVIWGAGRAVARVGPTGLSTVHAPAGGLLVLRLDFVKEFAARCPEQYTALIECNAFVNWRRIESGGTPVLALSFCQ